MYLLTCFCMRQQSLSSTSVLSQTEETTISRYISAMETEVNPTKNYEKSIVLCLRSLAKKTRKSFENMTKEDIILFLNSFKKSEPLDPLASISFIFESNSLSPSSPSSESALCFAFSHRCPLLRPAYRTFR